MAIKNYIIDDLKQLAMKSDVSNKHSAALIKNNTILKYAFNKFVKKEVINDSIYHLTIHAEINAIYSYYNKKNVKGFDIIVIRINKFGTELKNSRPCNHCIKKLIKLGISKVYYSNENGDVVYEYLDDMKLLHTCSAINNRYKIQI